MHKVATKSTRLFALRGRLVLVTAALLGSGVWHCNSALAQPPRAANRAAQATREGASTREARDAAIQRIPFQLLTQDAATKLRSVINSSSYFRSMPSESVDCDPEMFTFLVRNPEVIVNIWDVMGVTKVSLQRTGKYQLLGNDGAGTSCKMDLIFGNDSMHIYFANGSYQGNLWARDLQGRCVVVLHNRPVQLANGKPGISATMDVFMKLDNMGADLVVKTLGPLVGKTADYNFVECAQFVSQISQTAEQNPYGIEQLAKRLNKIDPSIRDQFVTTTMNLAQRSGAIAAAPVKEATTTVSKATKPVDAKSTPMLSSAAKPPTAPAPESSSRRQPETAAVEEDRVDSPTILILGKADDSK